MKTKPNIPIALTVLLLPLTSAAAAPLSELKVLYVGDADLPRAAEFKGFLKLNVGQTEIANRSGFDARQAGAFDVVLFDWPQSDLARENRASSSPLGTRGEWSRPTVLLGSAGLNLAVAWKAAGGSG
jgi:hypothetical protein